MTFLGYMWCAGAVWMLIGCFLYLGDPMCWMPILATLYCLISALEWFVKRDYEEQWERANRLAWSSPRSDGEGE